MLIKEGKLDEGLDLMKQAIKITPEDPGLHMNYGSMLFTKGQNVFESGNSQEGKAIFKEVEQELSLAIQLFKESDNILKSQCSFLLGDLYKKALEYYPEHGGAIDALKKFDGSGYAQDRANKLQPHFDNRKWVLGYQGSIDTASLMEYVIEGETVENWSELVTVASQKQTTPEEFMKTTKERIARLCPTIEWKVLSKSDKEIMYECMITNCPGQDNQHEIARIISGENGIHRMHYVTKKVPITSEKREEWIGLLKMFAQSENLSK
jgi:tetratricopeptide (TPR) repeat protein